MKHSNLPPPSLYKDTYGQVMERGYLDKWWCSPQNGMLSSDHFHNRNLQNIKYDSLIKKTGYMIGLVNQVDDLVLPIENINKTLYQDSHNNIAHNLNRGENLFNCAFKSAFSGMGFSG